MFDTSDALSEDERSSLFRPFTRESLAEIEARIAEEHAKQKELEKKRAEGEVFVSLALFLFFFNDGDSDGITYETSLF